MESSPLLAHIILLAQQLQPGAPQTTTVTVPDNLVSLILSASSATIIIATFGNSVRQIILSAGKNVPIWFEQRSQGGQTRLSSLTEMEGAMREMRQTYSKLIEDLRSDMNNQGQQHDRQIAGMRKDLDNMTQLHQDQEVLLSGAALKIKTLETEKEEWKQKAEDFEVKWKESLSERDVLQARLKEYEDKANETGEKDAQVSSSPTSIDASVSIASVQPGSDSKPGDA